MVPILDYLLERQISPQWRGMLTALATEFEAQIGRDELRQLMHRVGSRFAAAHPLPACDSTAELARTLNLHWHEMDWGYVELADEPESLRIVHYCAPLQAFGGAALAWTPAFLEGVYQTWLSALGAQGLSVAQTSGYSEDTAIEFRLGRHPV
ncbi:MULTISPECIES: cellulose biosynthesis protein BcsD [unclassified Paraburkholderia]|uniref:cellulose biosynthesis protein BcsD n=1 Tax=unclassified Paraburkholderia TaxID=2615204 RepID=UPI000E24B32B|nr:MULTISPECIES: cellulose biosynthesis protein BcsD [unclassified Paraburkholderia]REE24087.1 cellulose synthase subunit D [Paraburkholderia sp. BL27I4N3]RKR38215.1 cellulose synthase subunit D [Paraburkholderia sp. BL17N1]